MLKFIAAKLSTLPKKAAWYALLLFSCPVNAQQNVGYDSFLTNQVENNQPLEQRMDKFDCSDRIYLVLIVAGLSRESHELKVRWLDPHGTQQELTRYDFDGQRANKIWAWLQLNGPTGAIIGQMFDPSFGMEEFIGDWHAEVFIDGDKVASEPFKVLC